MSPLNKIRCVNEELRQLPLGGGAYDDTLAIEPRVRSVEMMHVHGMIVLNYLRTAVPYFPAYSTMIAGWWSETPWHSAAAYKCIAASVLASDQWESKVCQIELDDRLERTPGTAASLEKCTTRVLRRRYE